MRRPDGAQPKEDALVRAQADGGARQAPGRRVAGPRLDAALAALARPRSVHSSLRMRAHTHRFPCIQSSQPNQMARGQLSCPLLGSG